MAKIRVLVVEDSLTIRRALCEILRADPELEVVGDAADGKRGVELCRELRPDAITLDMCLPQMSGLAATEQIMAHFPTPILIVSASTNRGELFKTYDALAAGAVDVLEKPLADTIGPEWEHSLRSAVKRVSRISVITHPRARLRTLRPEPAAPHSAESAGAIGPACRLLALGTSTGGPSALLEVLSAIPAPLPVPALIVLHIGEAFSGAFAEWLEERTAHPVRFACGKEALADLRGRVILAPPGRHLSVRGGRLQLTDEPERHSCRPSIDVLFESLARECGTSVLAGVLTGMGRDGAAGLLELRRAGASTFAQDEATSTVYGMPREAARLQAAQRVLPLGQIAGVIREHWSAPGKRESDP